MVREVSVAARQTNSDRVRFFSDAHLSRPLLGSSRSPRPRGRLPTHPPTAANEILRNDRHIRRSGTGRPQMAGGGNGADLLCLVGLLRPDVPAPNKGAGTA